MCMQGMMEMMDKTTMTKGGMMEILHQNMKHMHKMMQHMLKHIEQMEVMGKSS